MKCNAVTIKNFLSCIFFIFCSVILLGCSEENPTEDQEETNLFIGSWKVMKSDKNSVSVNIFWIFEESTVEIKSQLGNFSGTYSYNQNADLKPIDLEIQGTSPNPNYAIYDFPNDDSLIIKVMTDALQRASDFSVEDGYNLEEFIKQ